MRTSPTDAQRVHTRRAFGFVLMSAFLPGSVQTFAGNRALGKFAGRVFGAVAVVLLILALGLLFWRGPTVGLILTPAVASTFRVVLWVLFGAWLLLLIDAWRLARPLRLERRPRLGLTITTLALALVVAGVSTFAANALVAVGNVGEVLTGGGETERKAGRYNILLLGADAADGREGLRPDSINVASIDAETGRTVLVGLPRNLQRVRFPEGSPLRDLYPAGYVCEDGGCMLNGIYTLGEDHADLYEGDDAGLRAMKEAVGETLGIELNYYALIDMNGFQSLIDAMGGIRLDIGKPIPIGGVSTRISGYIEPGRNRHLDGYHALWFARSRAESSDYERMARQKCVMSAMVKQLNPMTVATKFVELSEAGSGVVETDVGTGHVSELAELALKAKDLKIASVNFSPPLIVAADPDFELIRATVATRISESEALDEPKPTPATAPATEPATSAPAPTPTASTPDASPSAQAESAEASPTATASEDRPFTETEDLDAVCSVS